MPPLNSLIPSSATVSTSDSPMRIYLFGANTEGTYWMLTNQGFTTQSYDLVTGNWTIGTPMPTGRFDAGVAAVNGKLYVIGGYNYGTPSGPGFSPNQPVIYSAANEQYIPALDIAQPVDKTQDSPTPSATVPTLIATPTQST